MSESFGFEDYVGRKPWMLSHGYRQRVAIAEALVGDPDLLILDEPTTGLDPSSMIRIRDELLKMNKDRGMTILVSSHNLHLLERTADYYIFLARGTVVASGTLGELSEKFGREGSVVVETEGLSPEVEARLNGEFGAVVRCKDGIVTVTSGPGMLTKVFSLFRADRVLAITRKELYEGLRNFRFPLVLGVVAILSILSGLGGAQYVTFLQNQNAFGPIGAASPAIDYGALFGLTESRGLSLADLAILYSPVISILLSADLMSKERDSRTMVKLISKPITRSEILIGKSLALVSVLVAVGVVSPLISFASLQASLGGTVQGEDLSRLGVFTLVYILYLLVWGMIGLFYSNLFKKPITSYLVSILTFLVFSLLWANITSVVANSAATSVAQLESEQYMFRMLSITYIFSEVALFVLNPHYLGVNGGQYTFDWFKTTTFVGSLSSVWIDIVILAGSFVVLWVLNYKMFGRMNITPQG
ncbi:ATP-binding cassette domain-containing protein [Candidatus Bathyarchaeota archaeon]|nr:MAG: ATP-binding cassette domain-containing protein [Candidatus Bathyarchaeota archaeon]